MRQLIMAVVVTATLGTVATGCGPRFSVTEDQIEQDIVGKEVVVGQLGGWRFEQNEPRTITIVESTRDGERATIVIEMLTEAPAQLFQPAAHMAGRLRLHYEYVAKQWVLMRVESLTFRRI